jgi:hypothetical protein
MKMGDSRKHLGLVAVTTDNAAAISKHADDPTVFPVGPFVFEGQFQNAEKVLTTVLGNLNSTFFSFFARDSASRLMSETKLGQGPVSS